MYFTFHFDQFSLKTLQQQSRPVLSVPSSVVNDEVAVASRCYSLPTRTTTEGHCREGRAEQMGRAKIDDRGGAVVIQGAPSGSGPEIHMGWPYLTEVKHASCHKCSDATGVL